MYTNSIAAAIRVIETRRAGLCGSAPARNPRRDRRDSAAGILQRGAPAVSTTGCEFAGYKNTRRAFTDPRRQSHESSDT
jgi:hypothetical protein